MTEIIERLDELSARISRLIALVTELTAKEE